MGARTLNRLTARTVAAAIKPGRYADGGGLYFVVSNSGSRKWVFRYARAGQQRDMGLGSERDVPLAEARECAARFRGFLRAGKDPFTERQRERAESRSVPTFGEMADELIESIEKGFRNAKHRDQWRTTLAIHAKALRPKPVDAITTGDILAVLKPLWSGKAETAGRLRGRIERVLDAAKAKGFRTAENPARWRGHLDALLPRRHKLTRGHFAALAYNQLPAFMAALRAREGIAARALELTILTAARSNEIIGSAPDEYDLQQRLWTVPANRMKGGREHRKPLSECAIAVIEVVRGLRDPECRWLFPGGRRGKTLSENAMLGLLQRMGYGHVTVHGFRSTFRDWVGECTHFPREVAEASLAHVVGDATEQAYRRGDALEKRRILMAAWADYCATGSNNVVPLRIPA
jgi:integrase